MPKILDISLFIILALMMIVGAFFTPRDKEGEWTRRDWIGGGVYLIGIIGFVVEVFIHIFP